jgi:hypothetical protein
MGNRADNDFLGGEARRAVGMAATSPRRARRGRARARLARVSAVGALLAGGALAGCGGVSTTASSSRVQPLEVSSPAVVPGKGGTTLPALYTCGGRDISPPLSWSKVPANTAELALFLLDLSKPRPGAQGTVQAQVEVAWAVHGLSPALHGMAAGKLPAGASTGRRRYSICPPKGRTGEYMFRLYALPRSLAVKRNVSDLALFKQVNRASSTAGYLISLYTRH